MARRLLLVLLVLALAPGLWLRSPVPPADPRPRLAVTGLALPAGCCAAGPVRLTGAWQLSSGHGSFGGYSALVWQGPGRLLAFSDRGTSLEFSVPGSAPQLPRFGAVVVGGDGRKAARDVEAAVRAPDGGVWLALEGRNALARLDPDLYPRTLQPLRQWQDWPANAGAEALARLRDGRLVVLCECRSGGFGADQHPGLIYSGDPLRGVAGQPFTLTGSLGYRPTDMAQLPDGRVLIVARALRWPVPARFAIRLLVADPAQLRPGASWPAQVLAELDGAWPVDNFEGLAVEPRADGQTVVWLISDDNGAVTQRTLLLRLELAG